MNKCGLAKDIYLHHQEEAFIDILHSITIPRKFANFGLKYWTVEVVR